MPKFAPRKNIVPVLVDIKNRKTDYGRFAKFSSLKLDSISQPPPKNFPNGKIFIAAGAFILLGFALYSLSIFLNLKGTKEVFAKKSSSIFDNFSSAAASLKTFSPGEASARLRENKKQLEDLNNLLGKNHSQIFFGALGNVVPIFKEAGGLLQEVSEFNLNFLKVSEILTELQVNGLRYFQSDGGSLMKNLAAIKDLMSEMQNQIEKIRNTTVKLETVSPAFYELKETIDTQYLKYRSDLELWDGGLNSLIQILNSPADKHLLLIFQNPAEIRPGGGFIGSYADLTVANGQMKNIDVQDIYWPDHPMNLKLKVVPPQPLQTVTEDWGARDANWFFDFPTSARTVLKFLEASKIYEEPGVKFEGVIGLNINILETIIHSVGPINIEEYGIVIDENNFLEELQREVEEGRDKKLGSNPKRILKVLTPIVLQKLQELSADEQEIIFERLKEHLVKKDILIFAREPYLASLLGVLNLDGAVYGLPNNFWGSYLAVVNANIASGKSDVFINQSIDGRVDVDTDGGVFTDLAITREHHGDKEKDWWWRADNKNFIQIFTTPGSSLIALSGNTKRNKISDVDYKALNYEVNLDLSLIENTSIFLDNYSTWMMQEFGKTVFATWLVTPSGKTTTLNLRYQTPASKDISVGAGSVFDFIFERQSGVKSKLHLKIGAPLGYKWQESNGPVFDYENDDPDGRIMFHLTLVK